MSLFCISLGISGGITLLLYAYLFWSHVDTNPTRKKYRCEMAAFLVFCGLILIIFTLLNTFSTYQTIFSSISTGGIKLVLIFLGLVMSITTAGVITISRNVLVDIRNERQSILEKFKKFDPLPLHLQLELMRLNLAYQNKEELKALVLSKNEDIISFRTQLDRFYSLPNNNLDLLTYLNTYYNRERHRKLLKEELDYLDMLKEHNRKFPSEAPQESKEIIKLITNILRK